MVQRPRTRAHTTDTPTMTSQIPEPFQAGSAGPEPLVAPVGSPEWCARTLERMGDAVVALDAEGTVVWTNAAGARALDESGELIGRSAFDFVHPDDLERAMETIAFGSDRGGSEAPVAFRLGPPGRTRRYSVRGHGLHSDPDGITLLAVGREADHDDMLDQVLDELAGASNYHRIASLICHQVVHPKWGNGAAVRWGGQGLPAPVDAVALDDTLTAAIASHSSGTWLERCTLRAEGTVRIVAPDLPADLAALMEPHGFGAVMIRRIDDPGSGAHLHLVLPAPVDVLPNLGFGVAIERCARLLRLTLTHRNQHDQLEHSSRTDPLTGLANRRRFTFALRDRLARSDPVTVMVADLDGFKPINDEHGHRAGDLVLVEVGRRLAAVAGPDAVVARLGGDEFAVVTVDATAPDQLMERCRRAVEGTIVLPDRSRVQVGISLGCCGAQPGATIDDVLDDADAACRSDKSQRQRSR